MSRQAGFTTIQYVVSTALSLLLFALVANVLVALYQRGAVRAALDEGVRAGIPAGAPPDACERRARAGIDSVARGALLRVDELGCERNVDRVRATARITVTSWFPMLVPDWRMTLHAEARREQ